MNFGVLTIALKYPLYGRFAYNLALSLKAIDYNIKISVIADDYALSDLDVGQKMIFYKIIKPKKEYYIRDEKILPLITKFYLNELTPYKDATLFVDADMVFSQLCDFNKLLNEMNDIEWTMANRGINDPDKGISEWVDASKLKETYPQINTWYDLSSEWIYWKNTKLANDIFINARKYYDEGKLLTRHFAGDKPDEPFFNLSLIELNHKPHELPWQPTYWSPVVKKTLSALEIKQQYYAFSAGGNHLPNLQRRIYDEFVKNAAFKLNTNGLNIFDKRSQIKERSLI